MVPYLLELVDCPGSFAANIRDQKPNEMKQHTLDWFWDLKLVPKWVLFEVRVEVAKVPHQQNSKLCEWKRCAAVRRNRNQQFKLVWRRYARVINPCFLGCLQRASLGRALQVPSAPCMFEKCDAWIKTRPYARRVYTHTHTHAPLWGQNYQQHALHWFKAPSDKFNTPKHQGRKEKLQPPKESNQGKHKKVQTQKLKGNRQPYIPQTWGENRKNCDPQTDT